MGTLKKLAMAALAVTATAAADHESRERSTFPGVICEKFCDKARDRAVLWYWRMKGETVQARAPAIPGRPPHCGQLPDNDVACCKSPEKRLYIEYIPQLGSKSPWRTTCR
jgi:hypothetical protein